jgi:SsrA-binding protein
MKRTEKESVFANNRRARHDYTVISTIEVGVALQGTEVKSIRAGMVSFQDAYASIENGELFLFNFTISPFEQGNIFNHDPRRVRKLLAHRSEIRKLKSKIEEKGLTLVPLSIYLAGRHVKLELGVCKGKKLYDKRHDLKKEAGRREMRELQG